MKLPTIKTLANRLRVENDLRPAEHTVYLQFLAHDDWRLLVGNRDDIKDQPGYWASTTIPGSGKKFNAPDGARDLLAQLKEQIARAKPEDDKALMQWTAAAFTLGYNELVKVAKSLEQKSYFRIMRAEAERQFVALGGKAIFQKEPPLITLTAESGCPFIEFREKDIELMRETVAAWDAKHS